MIHRETPKCPFCGKEYAKAVYIDQSDIPLHDKIIGDTFIRWEYSKHSCNEEKEWREKQKNDPTYIKLVESLKKELKNNVTRIKM